MQSTRSGHYHILGSVTKVTVKETCISMRFVLQIIDGRHVKLGEYSRADVEDSLLAKAHLGHTLVPTYQTQLSQQCHKSRTTRARDHHGSST
jgi:hypothetical protein